MRNAFRNTTESTSEPPSGEPPRIKVGVMPLSRLGSTSAKTDRPTLTTDWLACAETDAGRPQRDATDELWRLALRVDFFELKDAVVAEFRDQMAQHVQGFQSITSGRKAARSRTSSDCAAGLM